MSAFEFHCARTLEDALGVLAENVGKVRIVAGGTNVVPMIRSGEVKPALLLDISRLDELRGIGERGGNITLGALTNLADVAGSAYLRQNAPALWEAAQVFADPTTRRRSTIGGNLVNASPGADSAPPLLALGAEVCLQSVRGTRHMPLEGFFLGSYATCIEEDELITRVEFAPCRNSAFTKIGHRNAMAISIVTLAAALTKDKAGNIAQCRVALGSMGPKPMRAHGTESTLTGKPPDAEALKAAGAMLLTEIQPRDGLRGTKKYRRGVAGTLLERTVLRAYGAF